MKKRYLIPVLFVATIFIFSSIGLGSNTPVVKSDVVEKYGQLQVKGSYLCDAKGNPIQLKGMSTYSILVANFAKDTMKNLVKDWHVQVIRIIPFFEPSQYLANKDIIKQRTRFIIDQAIQHGIYVVLDWHVLADHDPNLNKEEAKAFFEEFATAYGKYPNIFYEICNEPNSSKTMTVTWEGQIKPYAEYIIPAIRAIDPDNIIIVGSDTWSQGVDKAADDPLQYSNLMYALHFYAGTHKQWLRDKADYAISKGLAIFVTEWGTTNSSGAGMLYLEDAQVWLDWMAEHKISWCNFSFSNYPEDTAALNTTTGMNGPWKDNQLTESGEWIKYKILGK